MDFADIFLEKLTNMLPEQIRVNEYAIKLEKGKQPPYRTIYSLGPVEFKTLKTYIETKLANGFIKTSKSPGYAPILVIYKPYNTFCLCVNFQGLHNLKIKTWYPLLLIGKFVDRLGQIKQFTQLDLTSAYY